MISAMTERMLSELLETVQIVGGLGVIFGFIGFVVHTTTKARRGVSAETLARIDARLGRIEAALGADEAGRGGLAAGRRAPALEERLRALEDIVVTREIEKR